MADTFYAAQRCRRRDRQTGIDRRLDHGQSVGAVFFRSRCDQTLTDSSLLAPAARLSFIRRRGKGRVSGWFPARLRPCRLLRLGGRCRDLGEGGGGDRVQAARPKCRYRLTDRLGRCVPPCMPTGHRSAFAPGGARAVFCRPGVRPEEPRHHLGKHFHSTTARRPGALRRVSRPSRRRTLRRRRVWVHLGFVYLALIVLVPVTLWMPQAEVPLRLGMSEVEVEAVLGGRAWTEFPDENGCYRIQFPVQTDWLGYRQATKVDFDHDGHVVSWFTNRKKDRTPRPGWAGC